MRLVSVVTSTRSLLVDAHADLGEQVVDLRARRAHVERRVDEARSGRTSCSTTWPACLLLVVGGRRRHEDRLRQQPLELLEAQRPVVERRRQPEAVVDEVLLARAVALVHAADLRDRHVALVDEHERVARQVVDQRRRRLARACGPTGGASSSRCPCRSRSRSSSRGRSACAARCAAPRSASSALTKKSFCSRELDLDRLDRASAPSGARSRSATTGTR